MSEEKPHENTRILIYGPDHVGFPGVGGEIGQNGFEVSAASYSSPARFSDYDCVIVFQETFERFERVDSPWSHARNLLRHYSDTNELDRRDKESRLLLEKGGHLCFVLWKDFVEQDSRTSYATSDLAKRFSNFSQFFRHGYGCRKVDVRSLFDEFSEFIRLYGAAWTHFTCIDRQLPLRRLAVIGSEVVSITINDQIYFIPSLIPEDAHADKYYELLCRSLVAMISRFRIETPLWAKRVVLSNEEDLRNQREGLQERVTQLDDELARLDRYKQIITRKNEPLVDAVEDVLTSGIGFKVQRKEEYKQDLTLLDENGDRWALLEIKGTNKNVTRENVNQTDSFRSRLQLPPEFPVILIANTFHGRASTLEEKDQVIAAEQCLHAANKNVLIMRTWDLLHLLHQYLVGAMDEAQIRDLLSKNCGWLKVSREGHDIIKQ